MFFSFANSSRAALPFPSTVIFYFHFVAALINPGKDLGHPLVGRTFAFKDKAVSLSSLCCTHRNTAFRKSCSEQPVANYPLLTLGCLFKENILRGKKSRDKANRSQISFGPTSRTQISGAELVHNRSINNHTEPGRKCVGVPNQFVPFSIKRCLSHKTTANVIGKAATFSEKEHFGQ